MTNITSYLVLLVISFSSISVNAMSLFKGAKRGAFCFLRRPNLPLSVRNFSAVEDAEPYVLKNGASISKEKLVLIMSTVLEVATSEDAPYVLPDLVRMAFEDKPMHHKESWVMQGLQKLHKAGLIEPEKKLHEDVKNVITSAIELDIDNVITPAIELDKDFVDLSIIRSPRAGKYLAFPLALHDTKYSSSSFIDTKRSVENNTLCLYLFFDGRLPIIIKEEVPLKRDDEKKIDDTPYIYSRFYEQYGFKSYGEYLDDRYSREVSQQEYIKLRDPFVQS